MIRSTIGAALTIVVVSGFLPHPIHAQSLDDLTWTEKKCVLYQDAWAVAISGMGQEGISAEFLKRNDEFIASGCTIQGNACPRSDQELELANMLTLMTMSEGMASTFVPFSCRNAE